MRKIFLEIFLILSAAMIGIVVLHSNQLFAQDLIVDMNWIEGVKKGNQVFAPTSPEGGNWLELDGIDDYAEAPDSDSLDVGDELEESLTVEAWIYPRSLPPPPFPYLQRGRMIVVSKQEGYWLALFSFRDPTLGAFYGLEFGMYSSPTSSRSLGVAFRGIALNQWYHIAGVFNNSEDTFDLYVNGKRYSWEFTNNINKSDLSLIVGGPPPSSDDEYFDGRIDEIRISDIVRYSSTFTPPSGPFTPDENTRALWHLGEPIGSTSFFDSSVNNNTMTGINGAQTGGPTNHLPTVTGVTPSSRGQGATSQDIFVTGTNFMDGADVSFSGDGITVNSTTFVSSTELIANIDIASDAPVGVRDVIVTNPESQTGTGEDMFEVNVAPTVSGTDPSSLPQGDQDVIIEGSGFVDNLPDDPNGPQLAANFGDGITVNSVTFVSETELIANISIAEDAAVGVRDVTVVNGDAGVGIGVGVFMVVPPLTVTGVTPSSRGQGATGQDIVVTGTNFMDGAVVSFSGDDDITVNSTTFVSPTELMANINIAPDATVSVRDVIVTNPDDRMGTGEEMFGVNAAPTVSGTEPSSLPQGATEDVTIEGGGFVDNPPDDPNGPQLAADFGADITVNSVTFISETELIANISIAEDAAVGPRDVMVVNGDAGVGIGVGIFTVSEQLPPIIEHISPEIGQISGGDEVTITGNYFQDGATVTLGGNPAIGVVVDSETQITAKTPPGELGITDVVVTHPDGQSSKPLRGFAYIPMYGDVSNDGTVSAYDAALILRFVVGLINTFPVSIIQSPEQITPRNYTISLPSLSARVGKQIQVPIAINDAKGLTAGGIILKYDPTILKPTQVASTLSGTYWKANTNIAGEVRFAFASTEPTSCTEKFLIIEFEALPNTEGQASPLILDTVQLSGSLNITKVNGMVKILPSQSLLLQNYPNPFNPETWIPYQLVTDSPVMISIYNARGQVIRTISLGKKNAGIYVTKDQAAYWDGRDGFGEKVASGVYFYTLQAGEFRATRKMVIMK